MQVVGLSMKIYVILIAYCKHHLKHQVEVFLSKIVGFILESQHSEFRHKMQVLDVLNNLSLDATSMLEIFMNYD